MTTTTTNHTDKKDDAKAKPATVPFDAPKAEPKAPKPMITAGEAVRLMLTTLKRVAPEDRQKVLAALGALA